MFDFQRYSIPEHEEPQEVIFLHGIWRHIKEFGIEGQTPRISSPVKLGRFPFSQNFRNFRFGGKWNTFRRFVPLENSQKKWKI